MDDNINKTIPFPLGMLVLDFVGTVFVALGLTKKFGGLDLLPVVSHFDQSGWLLIGLGVLLTLPFLLYILSKVREKAEQNITK